MEKEYIIKEFLKELKNVEIYKKNRQSILNMMFWEYENHNTHLFEDKDTKIYKIIPEKRTYHNSFLGSSLGFNKSTLEPKYIDILHKFDLDKKPMIPSPKNCIEFEKLKYLIIKFFELNKKK